MAIYYIDPHTTTNGTGTWASPWSFSSNARTGLTSSDEIRIKGVALTSLLTATTYTATYTNNTTLTITAGGGLGADFAAGNFVYLPDYDVFLPVASVATNALTFGQSQIQLPIPSTVTTGINLRKVDTTTYGVSTASGNAYTCGNVTSLTGVTVSDCWTDATTRVTDGTVKTFIRSSTSGLNFYSDSDSGQNSSFTINMQNTHVMPGTNASGNVAWTSYLKDSTLNFNQFIGKVYTAAGSNLGNTNVPFNNNTVTIKTFGNNLFFTIAYGVNNTFTITNYHNYDVVTSMIGSANNALQYGSEYTLTFDKIYLYQGTGGILNCYNGNNVTFNLNGLIDYYSSTTPSILFQGYGKTTINYGASFSVKYNKQASTKTSVTDLVYYQVGTAPAGDYYIPTISAPSGWTYTNATNITTMFTGSTGAVKTYKLTPTIRNFNFPNTTNQVANTPYGYGYINNCLVTYRDGSAPYEILGLGYNGYMTTTMASNALPVVTTDATVYRTTGPSLKSYLGTRTTAYWTNNPKSIKSIKIPVTSGTSYTITGYIRTDDSAYTNGDCRISIILNDAEVVGQNMTTSCVNAWEQFSLAFTATQTCEVNLTWNMYYATGAKSYWLDDLNVA